MAFVGLSFETEAAYNETAEMKRLVLLIVVVVMLAVSSALVMSDTSASLTNSGIPDNEITTSQTEASDSSASATIIITMTEILNEQSDQRVGEGHN